MKPLLCLIPVLLLASCSNDRGSATPGYWRPSTQADPRARFGLLLEVSLPERQPPPTNVTSSAK